MRTVSLGFRNEMICSVQMGTDPAREPKRIDSARQVSLSMSKNGWICQGSEKKDGITYRRYFRPETDMDRFDLLLQEHDWTYQMSDDISIYRRGEKQAAEIKALAAKIGPAQNRLSRNTGKPGAWAIPSGNISDGK